jgi:polysaccharide pyruvyl transferase WcaK-like protein
VGPVSSDLGKHMLRTLADLMDFIAINVNPYLDSWAGATAAGLNRSTFLTEYAVALRKVWEKIQVPYLFVCTQHMDVDITSELQEKLDPEMYIGSFSNRNCGHQDIKGALGRAGLTVGMRLHSIILSASMRVPVVGLAYQPKVKFFLESNGLEDYCLHFNNYSAESLSSVILRAWQQRDQIREYLERRVPELEAAARIPAELVQQLLEPSV